MALRNIGVFTITNGGTGTVAGGVTGVIGNYIDPSLVGTSSTDVQIGDFLAVALPNQTFWRWKVTNITSTAPLTVDVVLDDDPLGFPAAFSANPIVPSDGILCGPLGDIDLSILPSFETYGIPAGLVAVLASVNDTQLRIHPISTDASIDGDGNAIDLSIAYSTDVNNVAVAGTDGKVYVDGSLLHADDDVESVTGTAVDNTDVRNPVIDLQVIVSTDASNAISAGGDLGAYLNSNGLVADLDLTANILQLKDGTGANVGTSVDISPYLDDTNLARLVSGTLNGTTGIATITRDDASTFTIDFSAFLSDLAFTGATALVAGTQGDVPAPAAGDEDKYLAGDGTWKTLAAGHLDDDVETVTGTAVDNTDARNPIINLVDEVVESAGALSGAAPTNAELGVDTTTGDLYYVVAGNWTIVPSGGTPEVIQSSVPLTQGGAAPVGAKFGFWEAVPEFLYIVDGSGNWDRVDILSRIDYEIGNNQQARKVYWNGSSFITEKVPVGVVNPGTFTPDLSVSNLFLIGLNVTAATINAPTGIATGTHFSEIEIIITNSGTGTYTFDPIYKYPDGTPLGTINLPVDTKHMFRFASINRSGTSVDWRVVKTTYPIPAGGGTTAFADAISPASNDATGAVGVVDEAAREDHKHPAQGISANANNALSVGTDGLHHLPLNASGFSGNLATTDNTLQEVADKFDALATTVAYTHTLNGSGWSGLPGNFQQFVTAVDHGLGAGYHHVTCFDVNGKITYPDIEIDVLTGNILITSATAIETTVYVS